MRTHPPRMAVLALALGAAVAAGPAAPPQPAAAASWISVTISSAVTTDCTEVRINYSISWLGMALPSSALWPVDRLWTYPGHTTLAEHPFTLAKWARRTNNQKGAAGNLYVRESGYFDHQVYGLSGDGEYQIVLFYRNTDGSRGGIAAVSNPMPMPICVPAEPTTGPAAGGTLVTIHGGGTFSGLPFTAATTVAFGADVLVPTSVAADGRWLVVATPPGSAGTCVPVSTTDPGLPFSLPDFCYDPQG